MDLATRATELMLAAGADHASCTWDQDVRHELNAEWDEVSLLRSTTDHRLRLEALIDGKRASLTCNDLSDDAVRAAVTDVVTLARASRPDPANAIAPASEARTFEAGPAQADLDAMTDRLAEFLAWRKAAHPKPNLRQVHFDFTSHTSVLHNSHGVDLRSRVGVYRFLAVFSSKQGADVSSFNYSGWQGRALDRPMSEVASFDRLLGQTAEQTRTGRIPEKFVGDVVITPDCLSSFLGPMTDALRDQALISGTSMFQDALGEGIADPKLTIHSRPVSAAAPSFFTRDGFVAEDTTLVQDGVLRSYLLSLYGANKTGRDRAANEGGCFVVEPGERSLDELVASIDRGVLLCRFSGGRPSDNGDFSGIAKNSYYIENGRVREPISETMVSGNLRRMLHAVRGISRERVDFGVAHVPWVQVGGLTVS